MLCGSLPRADGVDPSAPRATDRLRMDFFDELGIENENSGVYAGRWLDGGGDALESTNPATGERLGSVRMATPAEYDRAVEAAREAFGRWRQVPAPARGEYVRRMGEAMRAKKDPLGRLITAEMGKILPEGLGEVQECIDIADFAVGQSRMLYGLSMHSERPGHAMREQWHPYGVVGCITAFNFPMAVWAWNSMLALICGDAILWKPSLQTPLSAIALTNVCRGVLEEDGLGALIPCVVGSNEGVAERLVDDQRLPLVSFTGSCAVGKRVGGRVAGRFGRSILELGGNNAVVVMDDADLDMAVPAILFGAVGTAGQRCTSTRRVIVHRAVADELERRLVDAYGQVRIGNPLEAGTLCGPLVSQEALERMQAALTSVQAEGGTLVHGGEEVRLGGVEAGGHYARPALVRAQNDFATVQQETFAPILYLIRCDDLDQASVCTTTYPRGSPPRSSR